MGGGDRETHKHSKGRPESWSLGRQTTAEGCHKYVVINDFTPNHGMLPPTPVTPEEKRREMAKCLLGLKLLQLYKWYTHCPAHTLTPTRALGPPSATEGR